jgi:hypothetical protein
VDDLVAALGPSDYADAQTIREAIGPGRAFNLIHIPSTFKIDIFPLGKDEYSQESFARRTLRQSRWPRTD